MPKELKPRTTMTAGQGNETVELTKTEISKLTALSGLLSLFMLGSDAPNLFNADDANAESKAMAAKTKTGKGLFPSLKDLVEAAQVLNKPESVLNQTVKHYSKAVQEFLNKNKIGENIAKLNTIATNTEAMVNKLSEPIAQSLTKEDVTKSILNAVKDIKLSDLSKEDITNSVIEALSNPDYSFGDLSSISDIQGILTNAFDRKLSDVIAAITTLAPSKKEDISSVSKILIELNGNTDLSKLIETLYLLNDKDISDETVGLIAKLDKIVNAVKSNISNALDIDVSGAISKITDLNEYVKAVQAIIASIQSLQLEKSINTEILNTLDERIAEVIEALIQINIDPKLISTIGDNIDSLSSVPRNIETLVSSEQIINDQIENLNKLQLIVLDEQIKDKFNEQIDSLKLLSELEIITNDKLRASFSHIGDLLQFTAEQIVSIKTGFESLTDSINIINTIFDKLSTLSIGKLPKVLDSTSNVFIGNFISEVAEASDELDKFDLSQLSKDFSRIINAIVNINDAVKVYNEQIGKGADLKLNHFMWHAIPDVLLASSDRFFGKFIQDILTNLNLIALLDYSDTARLLHAVGVAYQTLYNGIEDYNSYIQDNTLDIAQFNIDEEQLNELEINIDKLIHFMASFNEIMSEKISNKILSNIDTNISQLLGSVNLIEKLNNTIDEINKLDVQLVEFKYSISENFGTQLNEFLVKLNSLNKIFDSNKFEISSELSKFTDIISSIRDMMFKLNVYSFVSKNSKQRINLENFAYSITDEFINQLDTFVSQLNKLTISFNDNEAKQLDSFISLFERISSSLYNLKNNILNKSIVLDKDTLTNIEISDEFNKQWIELNEKINNLSKSDKIDIKSLQNVKNNIELLNQLIEDLNTIGNQTFNEQSIKDVITSMQNIITLLNAFPDINKKDLLVKQLTFDLIKSSFASLNMTKELENIGDISKISDAESYIAELGNFVEKLININIPDSKKMEDKVYQFIEIKKILDVLSQFEPVSLTSIKDVGPFIQGITTIAQTTILPEEIEWIIPVTKKLATVNDIVAKIDMKNFVIFAEAIKNLKEGFKGIAELDVQAFKNNFMELGNIDLNNMPKIDLIENLSKMISHINNIPVPAFDIIETINKSLTDKKNKETISALFENIVNIVQQVSKDKDDITSLEQTSKLIKNGVESLVAITNIKEIPNKKAIEAVNDLIKENGIIVEILHNLKNNFSEQITKDAENNIKLINNLFNSVSQLGELGLRKKLRMKINIWFIKNFLLDDIISIIKDINKSGKKIQSEMNGKLFEPFNQLLDAIIKLSELDDKSKTRMIKSLWWIKHFITNMVLDLTKTISKNAAEVSTGAVKDNMEVLKTFIESIPAVADFNLKKLISYTIKVRMLQSFVRNSIQDLITDICELENVEEAKTHVESTQKMIEAMKETFGQLPGLKSIAIYMIKTGLLTLTVMPLMISYVNQVVKMTNISKTIDEELIKKTGNIIIAINAAIEKLNLDYEGYSQQTKDAIKTLKNVDKLLDTIIKLSKTAKEIDVEIIKKVNDSIKSISEIEFKKLADSLSDSAKAKDLVDNMKPIIGLSKKFAVAGVLSKIAEKGAESTNKIIDHIIEGIKKFDDINEDSLNKAEKGLETFEKLVLRSACILLIGALAMTFIKVENLLGFSLALTGFIVGLGFAFKQAAKFVDDHSETIDAFTSLVVKSSFVLILGSIVYSFLNAEDILGFTLILTGFIFGVMKAYQIASKSLASSMDSARDFATLVLYSGAILILGSIVSHFVTVGDLLAFTGSLLLLIGGTVGIYILASKLISNDIYQAANDVMNLIFWSGITLMAGALIAHLVSVGDLLAFTGMLLILIGGTTAIYVLASKFMEDPKEIAGSYIDLIVVSGLILMLGSLITKVVSFGDILTFTLMLGTFIGGTMLVYTICNAMMDDAKKGWSEFSKILIISGVLLIVGSLLTKLIGIKQVLAFTAMLGTFIGGTMLIYAIASHYAKDSMQGLKDFGVILIASGILLMIGALLVTKIGWEQIASFALMLAAFVAGIMTIYVIASKNAESALKGAAEFGALVVCASLSLFIGALTMKQFGGVDEAMLTLGGYALVLLLFVAGLIGIYTIFGKRIEKSIAPAAMMGVIAILSSVALAIGIATMDKYPNGANQIFEFVAADLILIGGLSLLAVIMGKVGLKTMAIGAACLAVMVGIGALSALVIGMIADIGNKYDLSKVWVVMGQIGVLIAALTAIAAGLGAIAMSGIGAAIIRAGIVLLASIVGVAYLAAEAMKAIAEAMIAMSKVKKFDPKPIIDGVKSFVDIAKELTPLADQAGNIIKASIAMSTLSIVLSKISQAVQEYAELKVPVYKGTEVVEYRQLNKKDFKSAADNVKLIIETLGGAVMESYDKHPDMFETNWIGTSVFSKVTTSLSKLGPMLSKIASNVQEYASLKVPVYKGTEVVEYRQLQKKDFQDASTNVKLVIETLGGAVMESYDAHPDMFETNWIGTSVFSKVTTSLGKLGPMLSKIAKSVADYASLKVPTEWDKEGNPTGYEHLNQKMFEDAANNVKLIIDTLGGAIIKTYEAHPDYYETSGGIFGFGGSSPFTKTIDANMKLAKLISKISISVKDFASSKVPIAWDKDGNATEYEHLEQKHFQQASDCIVTVITTLGEAVIKSGQKMDEVMSPKYFKKVVDAQGKLGDLISKISKSVLEFASGKVQTGYDKDGNALGYEQLSNAHFQKASECIITVITTLGEAVMKSGEKMDEIMSPNKFKKVVEAQGTLGDLISKISESVLNFASGKVATGYDKDGNALGYEALGQVHFRKASDCINDIITTLGRSIMESYEKHEDWFDDGEDSDFAMACKAIGSMGGMISEIANGIQAYADLKVPKYDANGAITGYAPIGKPVFKSAAETIGEIITTLGRTIMNEYEKHDDWFDDGPESDMAMAAAAIGSMGTMLSSIANGIQSYAQLMIPDKWDETGNPIHWKQMSNKDFENAGESVGKVVSTLGKTIMYIYKGKDINGKPLPGISAQDAKDMFDPKENPESPFMKVVQGCTMMGDMIGSIAEGVQMYASLSMPTDWDENGKPTKFTKMDPKMFKEAGDNIALVITTIGSSIMSTFGTHKNWFELPPLKQKGGFLGLCTVEAPNPGDPPFIKVMKGLGMMGGVIASIAQGVETFANGKMPKYDDNGQIVGYQPIEKQEYTNAAKAISSVITIMGQTLQDVYYKHRNLFWGDAAKNIMDASIKMGTAIGGIARGIQTYANMKYATDWDENGKPKAWQKMEDSDFENASITIGKVLKTIAEAIADAANNDVFKESGGGILGIITGKTNKVTNMLNAVQRSSSVLSSLAFTIQRYANLRFGTAWDKNGKPIAWERMQEKDFISAARSIKKVMTSIANAIVNAVDGNEEIFGKNIFDSPAFMAAKAIGKMGEALNVIARSIAYYAKSQFPIIEWKNGKANTTLYKLDDKDYTKAEEVIKRVTLCLGETLTKIYNMNPEMFDAKEGNPINNITKGLTSMVKVIKDVAKQLTDLIKIDITKVSNTLSSQRASIITSVSEIANMYDYMVAPKLKTIARGSVANPLIELQDANKKKLVEEMSNTLPPIVKTIASIYANLAVIEKLWNSHKGIIDSMSKDFSLEKPVQIISESYEKIKDLQDKMSETTRGLFGIEQTTIAQIDPTPIIENIIGVRKIVNNIYGVMKSWNKNQITGLDSKEMIDNVDEYTGVIARSYELIGLLNDTLKEIAKEHFNIENIDTIGIIINITSIKTAIDFIYRIIGQWPKNTEDLDESVIDSLKNATLIIERAFNELVRLQETMSKKTSTLFGGEKSELISIKSGIIGNVIKVQNIVNSIFNAIKSWQENINGLNDSSLDTSIVPLLEGFKNVADVVKTINSSLGEESNANANLQQWYGGMMAEEDEPSVFENINALNSSIADLIAVSIVAEQTGENGYNTISKGINKVQGAIDNIKGLTTFAQHREILEKYVKTVNSINNVKIDKMTGFVNAMNKLANKMGNIDGLTNAIAENLTSVLEKLTVRMEEAKKTILKSEELQDRRQNKMEKTISNIKSIMRQKLTIEISQVNDNDTLQTNPSGGNDQRTQVNDQSVSPVQSQSTGNTTISGNGTVPEPNSSSQPIGGGQGNRGGGQPNVQGMLDNSTKQTIEKINTLVGRINTDVSAIKQGMISNNLLRGS